MKNKIEVEADCVFVGPIEELGQSKFKKRIFVIEESESDAKFPTTIAFALTKERTGLVNESMKGKRLKVSGYVESRAWNNPKTGKVQYFTEVNAVAVSVVGDKKTIPEPAEPSETFENEAIDDMPF